MTRKNKIAVHANPASVVKVGGGRGFIIEHREKVSRPRHLPKGISLRRFVNRRLVVTAAHCLPKFPPALGAAAYMYERTYNGLLGSLDGSKSGIWAECLFADPIADVAVPGCPDEQKLGDEADAYSALTDDAPVLRIDKVRSGRGWVLALDGCHWVRTTLKVFSSAGGASLSINRSEPGMSGSPILNNAGVAVGLVSIGTETVSNGVRKRERAGPQPILIRNLPGWLLQIQGQLKEKTGAGR